MHDKIQISIKTKQKILIQINWIINQVNVELRNNNFLNIAQTQIYARKMSSYIYILTYRYVINKQIIIVDDLRFKYLTFVRPTTLKVKIKII